MFVLYFPVHVHHFTNLFVLALCFCHRSFFIFSHMLPLFLFFCSFTFVFCALSQVVLFSRFSFCCFVLCKTSSNKLFIVSLLYPFFLVSRFLLSVQSIVLYTCYYFSSFRIFLLLDGHMFTSCILHVRILFCVDFHFMSPASLGVRLLHQETYASELCSIHLISHL